MKYYYLFWLTLLLSIFMYLLGSQDQANDLVASCEVKYGFVVDGKQFVCISNDEYFRDEK